MRVKVAEICWHETQRVLAVDFHPSGRLATCGSDSTINIWRATWRITSGQPDVELLANLGGRHTKSVNVVRFSPSGDYLASGSDDGLIFIWKYEKDKTPGKDSAPMFGSDKSNDKEVWTAIASLRGHEDIYDLAWTPDCALLLSGSTDCTARIWDLNKSKQLQALQDHRHYVQGVACDPRNRFYVTQSSDRAVRVYEAKRGKGRSREWHSSFLIKDWDDTKERLFLNESVPTFFRRPAWSPCGSLLFLPCAQAATPTNPTLYTTLVFSRHNFVRPMLHLPCGSKPSIAVRCSRVLFKLVDGIPSLFKLPYRIVFAVATLDSVLIYDTQHPQPIALVTSYHLAGLTDLAWSADGLMLVVASSDGYCSIVGFEEGELGTPLSPEEQRAAVGEALPPLFPAPVAATDPKDDVKDANGAATLVAGPPVPRPSTPSPVKARGADTPVTSPPGEAAAGGLVSPSSADAEKKRKRITPTFLGPSVPK